MRQKTGPVLLSWIAQAHDPYSTDREGNREVGPTLSLLTDDASPYARAVEHAVFFVGPDEKSQRAYRMTREQLGELCPDLVVETCQWLGGDPTDYKALFAFLSDHLPALRERFAGRELLIHISPGTPAMQTLWVLMAETGYVRGPLTMVKTVREQHRKGGAAAVPVTLGLDTLLKAFRQSHPAHTSGEDEDVTWDPSEFNSDALRRLYDQARRVAQVRAPVLLLGERGTGKTTMASWIRLNSPFRKEELDSAWPSVVCGQYTPETMRSELFGHTKGAFTDAKTAREGLLARADGDTLFLDEVGDISRDLQRLLIRAVEEGEYQPLGADEPERSTFRLVSATNLADDVLQERLDADFLDRVSLFRLRLPSLREIPEDIPWLWTSAYGQALDRSGRRSDVEPVVGEVHERIADRLRHLPLPGNMRDLLRVAYRLVAARTPLPDGEPMPTGDAIEFALAGAEPDPVGHEVSRAIGAAFSRREPLGPVLEQAGGVSVDDVLRDFQGYIASGVLDYAQRTDADPRELSGKGKSTLYRWRADAEGGES